MTKRIFKAIFLTAMGVFICALILMISVMYKYYADIQVTELKQQASLIAQGINLSGDDYVREISDGDTRITLIGADGSILYDSSTDAGSMENHLEREEVQQALKTGTGESTRYSTTLMERMVYEAVKLADGSILRVSGAQYTPLTLLMGLIYPIFLVIVLSTILSWALAAGISKRIVKPLESLSLEQPDINGVYEEMRPVVEKLSEQSRSLNRRKEEFETASSHMTEGMILLDEKGCVLSANTAACTMLELTPYCMGRDILLFNNSTGLQSVLRTASEGSHADGRVIVGKKEFSVNASPVISDGSLRGIVLLILDMTEKQKNEILRREFTANVSHELKSPLQTIAGSAELLAGGMVKAEDIPTFSAGILKEARRMSALIEDITSLSHLDEGSGDMPREGNDLYQLAAEVVKSLKPKAEQKHVALTLSGSSAMVHGIKQMLSVIIYNLTDNAIKYNKEDGSVNVNVENTDAGTVLTVSDTGIGIPERDKERVFERFYRVNKSRSREMGGTGLGLSIVKHAAKLHNADVRLESEEGCGTMITVSFPKN